MTEVLKRSGCALTSSDRPSSLEKSSSSFGKSASLTRTNSGAECALMRGEDGPAIELADERLLDDMVEQIIEHSNFCGGGDNTIQKPRLIPDSNDD